LEDGTEVEVKVTKNKPSLDLDKVLRKFVVPTGDTKSAQAIYPLINRNKEGSILTVDYSTETFVDNLLDRISKKTGETKETIRSESTPDSKSKHKIIIDNKLLDKRKFKQYPFDSVMNAQKAITQPAVELLCDTVHGHISPEKLVKAVETVEDEDDIFLKRILDQIISRLEWQE